MKRSIWPAVRTTGIAMVVAMLPAIYTQVYQASKDQADQYRNILMQLAGINQQCHDMDYRISELERYRAVH